jgi:tetratricopeptide (TPR) repeat protein
VGRQSTDHFILVRRGLELHEARKYARALPYFKRACIVAPRCATASYNRANTLHMLGKAAGAYRLLRKIVDAPLDELREGCPRCGPRGLQSDAYFLLSLVVQHWRGDCEEALRYASEHLKRRRRGLHSLWTINEVRAKLASIRCGVESAEMKATRGKRRKR